MSSKTEYVLKKGELFHGTPWTILYDRRETWSGKPRALYETDEFEILSQAEFDIRIEQFCETFCGNWKETSVQRYNDMLDVLPPVQWFRGGFFLSEAYTLNIHPFHQRYFGRYFETYFRLTTPRDDILRSLDEFIKSQEREVVKEKGKTYHAKYANHGGFIGRYVGNEPGLPINGKGFPLYLFEGGYRHSPDADDRFESIFNNKWVEEFMR